MAGTLTLSVLKNDTTSPTQFQNSAGTEIGQLCRAWVNFNPSAGAGTIRASFNVTSVTYNSTGNYTVNFANALPDANYSMLGTAYYGGVVAGAVGVITPTTTTCAIQTVRTDNMSGYNMLYTCVGFFR